ncbi:hypothetical protein XENTR_v10015255 [Xenopus tropicalis]|uniref:Zinc finger protein 135-like n=1 Tax=Xenopus tropicalis TaxID=8364 RepID=A0A8J0QPF9_XENTR|nr:zinc finger protein 135-like [Xenopus tropicalis]KAE8605641.1 hypothetical protein XENTR_v10015255 [Xenopus tropicalis]
MPREGGRSLCSGSIPGRCRLGSHTPCAIHWLPDSLPGSRCCWTCGLYLRAIGLCLWKGTEAFRMSDPACNGNNADDSSDSDIPWSYQRIQSHAARVKKEPMRSRSPAARDMNGNYTTDEEDFDGKLSEDFPLSGAPGTPLQSKDPLQRPRPRRQDSSRASPEKSVARERSTVDSSGKITLMTETVYKCNRCHKTFFTRSGYRKHQRNHGEESSHRCRECGESFPDWDTYTLHSDTHTGRGRCAQPLRLQSHLARHEQSRPGEERLNPCSVCAKCFAHSSSLAAHMAAHTGEGL